MPNDPEMGSSLKKKWQKTIEMVNESAELLRLPSEILTFKN